MNAEERSVKITSFSFFSLFFVSAYVSKRTKHQRTDDLAFFPFLRGNLFVINSFFFFIYFLVLWGRVELRSRNIMFTSCSSGLR